MAGSLPGSNSTSTTGPMTWTMVPWLMTGPFPPSRYASTDWKGFRPADNVQELLRDALLAGLVVLDGQEIDHLAGVLGRGLHGRHARSVLPGHGLHERPEDLGRHVARQERVEDGLGAGLVEVLLLRSRAVATAILGPD